MDGIEQKNTFIDPTMGSSFVTAALSVLTIMSIRYLQNIQTVRNVQQEETRYNNKYNIWYIRRFSHVKKSSLPSYFMAPEPCFIFMDLL